MNRTGQKGEKSPLKKSEQRQRPIGKQITLAYYSYSKQNNRIVQQICFFRLGESPCHTEDMDGHGAYPVRQVHTISKLDLDRSRYSKQSNSLQTNIAEKEELQTNQGTITCINQGILRGSIYTTALVPSIYSQTQRRQQALSDHLPGTHHCHPDYSYCLLRSTIPWVPVWRHGKTRRLASAPFR